MYGMVNKAVEDMILMHYDEATWEKIKARASVDVEVFIATEAYPDELTYRMVAAASEVLGMPPDKVLIAFGQHWILHTAREGYGGLLKASGRTLPEFLINLPEFHTRVNLIFPNLRPPRFVCSEVTPTSLNLHYHTERTGLAPFVMGLLQGLATMFATPTTIIQVAHREQGADHDVFHLSWNPADPA